MLSDVPRTVATAVDGPADRRMRLLAVVRDAAALLPPLAIAAAIAVAWLLSRTAWGRDDVRSVDSAVALALVATVPPAWLVRLALHSITAGGTPGQRAAGLRLTARRRHARVAVLIRLALHPLGTVGWAWLAATLAMAQLYTAALVPAAVGALTLLGGLTSLAVVLVAPGARGVHDRLAGTRLVRA